MSWIGTGAKSGVAGHHMLITAWEHDHIAGFDVDWPQRARRSPGNTLE